MRKARECHDEKSTNAILSKLQQRGCFISKSAKPEAPNKNPFQFSPKILAPPPKKRKRERSKQHGLQFSVL